MTPRIYANEIDPVACAVLRATMSAYVDERSIKDVEWCDLIGYDRCHFFCGAGLWNVAADMAGWRGPLWTASCPCQPFSVAGKGAGVGDPRHMWPDLFRLVDQCRPGVLVGEQVGGKAGYGWLDGVFADLESVGYACWAVDIPACAVDAPHRRNRIYWVAVGDTAGGGRSSARRPEAHHAETWGGEYRRSDASILALAGADGTRRREITAPQQAERFSEIAANRQNDGAMAAAADGRRCDGRPEDAERDPERRDATERAHEQLLTECEYYGSCAIPDNCALPGCCARGPWRPRWEWDDIADGVVVDPESERRGEGRPEHELRRGRNAAADADGSGVALGDASGAGLALRSIEDVERRTLRDEGAPAGAPNHRSFWMDAEWLQCADGKARRAKPGIRLLVDGMAGRADLWRLAGNSIVPQVAAEVLAALQDELDEREGC